MCKVRDGHQRDTYYPNLVDQNALGTDAGDITEESPGRGGA